MGIPTIPTRHQDSSAHRQRIAESVNNITNFQFDDSRVRTGGEITAGVTPVNYAYPPGDVRRYGFSSSADATTNTAAVNAAIQSLTSVDGIPGGTVQLPAGTFAINAFGIPQYAIVRGAGPTATRLNYAGTSYCVTLGYVLGTTLGDLSGVLQYGCGLFDLRIVMSDKDGHGVRCIETYGAQLRRLGIEGYTATVTTRTNVGITIDGGNGSSFENNLEDIICNHVRTGVSFLTTGSARITQQYLKNVSVTGDDSTYGASVGWAIAKAQGDGTVWIGGNIEHCHVGILPAAGTSTPADMGALSFVMIGTRFEANNTDIASANFQQPSTFIGINTEAEFNVSDANGIYTFVGCTTTSTGAWTNRFTGPIRAGTLNITQNARAGSYTLVLSDAGKPVYQTVGGTTITIPANASVPFLLGTEIEIANGAGSAISIAITSDTLILAGVGTTGTRTLTNNGGVARLRKIENTAWVIWGAGVT